MNPLPRSETHLGVNLLGVACGGLTLYLLHHFQLATDNFWRSLCVMLAVATPILLHDLLIRRVQRAPSAGLTAHRTASFPRIALKLLGFYGVLAFFTVLYIALPEYDDAFYRHYFRLLSYLAPLMALLAPFYFWYLDRLQNDPEDAYTALGRFLLGNVRHAGYPAIGRLLRNWLVKAFFMPIMFIYFFDSIAGATRFDVAHIISFSAFYIFITHFAYLVDLVFAAVGYVLTLRIANAHIRSSEPTFFGWAVAIACYAPFWNMFFSSRYFAYANGPDFTHWFQSYPMLIMTWGSVILGLLCIYSLATVCLGIRFSNLTYRGLVTNGPYAYCKHPAYVAKSLTWWMISVPFLSQQGIGQAAINCLLLLGVNLLYFLRARTEERHLSHYPEYVAYAEAMNEQSLFAPLAKALPFLRYKKPEHLAPI